MTENSEHKEVLEVLQLHQQTLEKVFVILTDLKALYDKVETDINELKIKARKIGLN